MIVNEIMGDLVKTWSDENRYIVNDETGDVYTEAIDPVSMNRTYHEGEEIPSDEPTEVDDGEV